MLTLVLGKYTIINNLQLSVRITSYHLNKHVVPILNSHHDLRVIKSKDLSWGNLYTHNIIILSLNYRVENIGKKKYW